MRKRIRCYYDAELGELQVSLASVRDEVWTIEESSRLRDLVGTFPMYLAPIYDRDFSYIAASVGRRARILLGNYAFAIQVYVEATPLPTRDPAPSHPRTG